MKSSNITCFDSKGRLLIPSHIRKFMRVEGGTEVVIIPEDDKRQMRVIPLVNGKTAEIRLLLDDTPGSLARAARLLSESGLDIIISESRTMAKGRLAEWDVMVDISECDDLESVRKKCRELDNVKGVEILESK